MKIHLKSRLLASALVLSSAAMIATVPVTTAQAQQSVSFRSFHRQLRDHGDWYYSDRWGEVWQPYDAGPGFRPYRRGYWANTDDYGWYWVSDEPYGEITYHYGRWVNDPDDGWLWVPGYVWSPAWVVWRRSGNYVGWMPMPPDRRFLEGDEFGVGITIGNVSIGFNSWNDLGGYYGYGRWYGGSFAPDRFTTMWTFVPTQHFGDRNVARFALPPRQVGNTLRKSTNITNYTVVNNFIVNRSVPVQQGDKFRPVHAKDVVRNPDLIVPVSQGRQLQSRMRNEAPRGTGEVNSAPKPTAAQLDTLSSPATGGPGKHSRHLMDRNAAATSTGAATVSPVTSPKNDNGQKAGPTTTTPQTTTNGEEGGKHKDKTETVGTPPNPADQNGQTNEPKKKHGQEQTPAPAATNNTVTPPPEDQGTKKKHNEPNVTPTQTAPAGTPPEEPDAKKKKKHEDIQPPAGTSGMPADAGAPPHQAGSDTSTTNKAAPATTAPATTAPATTTPDDQKKKKKKHPDETQPTDTPQ